MRRPATFSLRDPLLRNSFFLLATTASMAAGGFLFWMVAARFYTAGQLGAATSLLSAIVLLSYFSMLGMGGSLVRYLPTSPRPEADIGTAVCTVAAASLTIGAGYALSLQLIAPKLLFVQASPALIAAFTVLAAGTAVNLLTDYVFIAMRAARYNFLINGLLLTTLKLGLAFGCRWLGSFGIVAAAGTASLLAAGVKLATIRRGLRLRFSFRIDRWTLRRFLSFSTAEYLASCLNLAPQLIIPLIILQRLDAAAAGAYFIAFQVATLLNSVSYAVGEAMFAEGSQSDRDLGRIMRRSAAVITLLTVPGAAIVVATDRWVLRAFSAEYSRSATGALTVLAISALSVAFYSWTTFLLKVAHQLAAMVVSNAVLVLGVTVLALVWADRGIGWVAAAWGVGNLISGGVAGGALLLARPRRPPTPVRRPFPAIELPTAELPIIVLALDAPTVEVPGKNFLPESGVIR